MRIEITDLHEKLGAMMIYVTQDQVEVMTMADKIAVLNGGQIKQVGWRFGGSHRGRYRTRAGR